MSLTGIVKLIDNAMAPAEQAPARPNLGRRFFLGAAVSAVALAKASHLADARCVPVAGAPAPAASASHQAAPVAVADVIPAMDHVRAKPSATEMRDWAAFRARFITADGRVVDSFNHGVSHTEGQGLGMLFAVAFDDQATFDRIWSWTVRHLRRGSDALFSWRFVPDSPNAVPDLNNATDGDIYIATALLRASSRWSAPQYLQASKTIARDIQRLLVRKAGGRTVLLPGATGFETRDQVTVNASYYVFPLLAELDLAYPSPVWGDLLRDGRKLVADAQFGSWKLPPDWLCVSTRDGSLTIADQQPSRFSFDAVRIPLFVAWDRGSSQALQPFADFWGKEPAHAPAWVDLRTGATAPYHTCGGVVAIATLVRRQCSHPAAAHGLPAISHEDEYYSAALILLSRLVARETNAQVA